MNLFPKSYNNQAAFGSFSKPFGGSEPFGVWRFRACLPQKTESPYEQETVSGPQGPVFGQTLGRPFCQHPLKLVWWEARKEVEGRDWFHKLAQRKRMPLLPRSSFCARWEEKGRASRLSLPGLRKEVQSSIRNTLRFSKDTHIGMDRVHPSPYRIPQHQVIRQRQQECQNDRQILAFQGLFRSPRVSGWRCP